MNMFDEARSLKCMLEARKMTQKELAKSLGVSTSYVANKLRLLRHTEDMQSVITESGITERHARALLQICNEEKRNAALARIIKEKMTVEQAEAMISIITDSIPKVPQTKVSTENPVTLFLDNLKSSCDTLTSLGTEVKRSIRYSGKKLCIYITIDET